MGRLRRIHDYVNKVLPRYSVAHTRLRGISLPADIFLSGTARFAKKAGNFLPVLIPQNTMRLASNIVASNNTITTTFFVPGLEIGALLSVARRELVTIRDFDTDLLQITLEQEFREDHPRRSQVFLHGVPITVVGNYSKGTSVIVVDSPNHSLYIGDEISIFGRIQLSVTDVFVTGGGNFQLTLAEGLPADLTDNQTIYLRAYPAYDSGILPVPTLPGSFDSLGPFVLDWVSGSLVSETDVDEIQTLQLYNSGDVPIFSGQGIDADKNFATIRTPVLAEQFLFWNIPLRGTINYNKEINRFITKCDDEGKWEHGIDLIPNWPTDQINEWRLGVTPDADCEFFFYFEPNGVQQFSLTGGTTHQISILLNTTDFPAERIRMLIRTDTANMEALLSDLHPVGSRVASFSHTLVAKVDGEYSWASSGLFMKPLWPTLEYLEFDLLNKNTLNNGRIL